MHTTDAQIEALRTEAGAAGDADQVAICDRALDGDSEARELCAKALADAAAQDDTLHADETTDGWTVVDSNGGRWWPHDDESEAIARSANPAVTVLALCRQEPTRGTWAD